MRDSVIWKRALWGLVAMVIVTIGFATWPKAAAYVRAVAAFVAQPFKAYDVTAFFYFLAFLPGAVSLMFWGLSERHTFDHRAESARAYLDFKAKYEAYRCRESAFQPVSELAVNSRTRMQEFIFGAIVVSLPFLIVASTSTAGGLEQSPAVHETKVGVVRASPRAATDSSLTPADVPASLPAASAAPTGSAASTGSAVPAVPPQPAATSTPARPASSTGDAPKSAPADGTTDAQERRAPDRTSARTGVVLAGYGAYFYLLLLLVHRINATALSPKFLVTSSLRASTSLVLGYLAGYVGLFEWLSSDTQKLAAYVLIGTFPSWAAAALQRKARDFFKNPVPGTEPIPLDLVDGVDEFIAERLSELGITDIQHLATSDVADLTLRTLYPCERVIDWIDQAILITYLKGHIVDARSLGIRGAIDMRGTYRDIVESPSGKDGTAGGSTPASGSRDASMAPRQIAEKILQDLASKSQLSIHVVYGIGRDLLNDYNVEFLGDLWHHRGPRSHCLDQAIDEALRTTDFGKKLEALGQRPPTAEVQKLGVELKDALHHRFDSIHPTWDGQVEELEGKSALEEIKRVILRDVHYS